MTAIDFRVEPLLREALGAVIGQDAERLQRAIAAFQDGDNVVYGVRLAAATSLFVLDDLHDGDQATEDDLAEIAGDIASAEGWTDVTGSEILKYLQAAYAGTPVDDVLPPERVLILSLVIAANLVASHHRDDENWWDLLDRAEAAIEAAPER